MRSMSIVDAPRTDTDHDLDDGRERPYVILGGGPAGLTAGYLLAQARRRVIVLEADEQVGGWPRRSSTPTAIAATWAGTASSPRARRSTTSGWRSWATSSSCVRGCRAST